MKKFLLKITIFLITTYSLVRLLAEFDNICSSENHNVRRIETSIRYESLDYLFVENSCTYSGIMLSIFDEKGEKSFNLSVATAGPYYMELIIDDYLKCIKCYPNNIISPVNFLMFTNKSDNWELYPIHRNLNNPTSNEKISIKYASYKNYPKMLNSSFKKDLNCLFKVPGFQHQDLSPFYKSDLKGFLPSDEKYSPTTSQTELRFYKSLRNESFNLEKFEHFKRILDKYRRTGINVIICDIPTFKLKNYISKSFIMAYQKRIFELQENNTFISIADLYDSTYFRNLDHLNSRGADLFTRQLMLKLN